MTPQPENPALWHIRAILQDVAELREDICEVKARLDNLAAQGASFSRRLGRVDDRWIALENDPHFLARVEKARASLHAGGGVKLEDL